MPDPEAGELFNQVVSHARAFLDSLPTRPVRPEAGLEDMRAGLRWKGNLGQRTMGK